MKRGREVQKILTVFQRNPANPSKPSATRATGAMLPGSGTPRPLPTCAPMDVRANSAAPLEAVGINSVRIQGSRPCKRRLVKKNVGGP